jgi:hypothetical protein
MKKNNLSRFLLPACFIISMFFNSLVLKAQIDVLDLCTQGIQGCSTTPDIFIKVDINSSDQDTTVYIRNISGFRRLNHTLTLKVYEFAAANNPLCGTGATDNGLFRIAFESAGSMCEVEKLEFLIKNPSGVGVTARSYQNGTPSVVNAEPDGVKYIIPSPVDSIEVESTYDAGINTGNLFILDSLFILYEPACIKPDAATVSISHPTCSLATGTITITSPTGAEYEYNLDGGTYQTSPVFPGIGSGDHTIRVRRSSDHSCISDPATASVNEQPVSPAAPSIGTITQPTCETETGSVVLNNLPSEDTWTLTISPGNVTTTGSGTSTTVTGLTAETYTFTVTNASNCPSPPSGNVEIEQQPAVPEQITGITTLCAGSSVTLSDDSPGGTWESLNTAVATINSSGEVTGLSAGESDITYTLTSGCYTTTTVTVIDPDPASLPEVVCLYDLSYSMNRDFYDQYTTDPLAVKLYHARNALQAFIDLLHTNNICEASVGLARFPNSPQAGCDAGIIEHPQTLNTLYRDELINITIPGLTADGNSTPLFAGIDTAIKMLNTTTGLKTIVLLTDGRQNCPYSAVSGLLSSTNSTLVAEGIKLFTIGFGDNNIVPNDILSQLVTGTGGTHYNIETSAKITERFDPAAPDAWNAGTALNSVFANIIEVLINAEESDDPLDIINQGEIRQFGIPVTIFDDRICFFISWVTPQKNYLGVKLVTPSGSELSLDQAGIDVINRDNHTIITLYDAVLDQPGMTGIWQLVIDGSALTGASEYYQHTVLNISKKLDLKTWFEKEKYLTGDKIKIYAELLLDGKPLTNLDESIITGTRPAISPGNWLVSKKLDEKMLEKAKQKQLEEYLKIISGQSHIKNMSSEAREQYLNSQSKNFLETIDPVELRVHALRDEYQLSAKERVQIKGLYFMDDGTGSDEKAGDGIYTAIYKPKLEGSYEFDIACSDTGRGQKILRGSHLQTYVGTRISIVPSFKNIRVIGEFIKGQKTFELTFKLKDKYGNIPLPSVLEDLKVNVGKGTIEGGIIDNMDGTFKVRISLPKDIKRRNVDMTFSYLDMSESRKITRNRLLPYIISGSLIVIAGAGIWLRRRKR